MQKATIDKLVIFWLALESGSVQGHGTRTSALELRDTNFAHLKCIFNVGLHVCQNNQ